MGKELPELGTQLDEYLEALKAADNIDKVKPASDGSPVSTLTLLKQANYDHAGLVKTAIDAVIETVKPKGDSEHANRSELKQKVEKKLREDMKPIKKDLQSLLQKIPKFQKVVRNCEAKLNSFMSGVKLSDDGRRRLATMPPSHEPLAPETGYLPSSASSAVSVGLVATAGLCVAFVLRRFYNRFTAKRRDSFGFEPDSRRA